MALTERSIDAIICPQGKKQAFIWDEQLKGFGLRVTAGGSKAFIVQYRVNGLERRVTIGKHPAMKAAAARRTALRMLSDASIGVDHALEKARRRRTWKELWDWYDANVLIDKSQGYRHSCRNNWNLHLHPLLGARSVAATTYSDIETVKSKLGRRTTTNRCLALLSSMANRAIRLGWTDRNPAQGVERIKEKGRQRYLTQEEVTRLLQAADGNRAEDAIRLLLLTGARVSELLRTRWADLDLSRGLWTKPDTKSGESVSVPLNATAIEILTARSEEVDSEFVFPNPSGTGPQGSIRRQWLKVVKQANIKDFRLHDLRHSHASMLVNSGFNLHDVGALLGHKSQRTTARYAHLSTDRLRSAVDSVAQNVVAYGTIH